MKGMNGITDAHIFVKRPNKNQLSILNDQMNPNWAYKMYQVFSLLYYNYFSISSIYTSV